MKSIASEQFKRDYIVKVLTQQKQFEQWTRYFFQLNKLLSEEYNGFYQDTFYTKLVEILTVGMEYANKVISKLDNNNPELRNFLQKFVDGFDNIKRMLSEHELDYIEYRRHNFCHMFQNGYEHIQDNLKIKKFRNGKSLAKVNDNIKNILIQHHGIDQNVDITINKKLRPVIFDLYETLTK